MCNIKDFAVASISVALVGCNAASLNSETETSPKDVTRRPPAVRSGKGCGIGAKKLRGEDVLVTTMSL